MLIFLFCCFRVVSVSGIWIAVFCFVWVGDCCGLGSVIVMLVGVGFRLVLYVVIGYVFG